MLGHSNAIDLIWWTSLILCVGSIALILFATARNWRKPETSQNKRTLLLAIGILPLGTLYFSDQALFHSMQRVEFCNSCHVMEPFVNALQRSGEETLAAMHVQHGWIRENACYTCHTDYDIMGGVKAKVRGLRHLYAYYIGDNIERPELYSPYPNGNCLACHSLTATFDDIEDHSDNMDEILSDDVSCLDCHETAHPQEWGTEDAEPDTEETDEDD